jgi:hypothetical protein
MDDYLESMELLYLRSCGWDVSRALELEDKPIMLVIRYNKNLDEDKSNFHASIALAGKGIGLDN